MQRFKGTTIHAEDLAEARVGGIYFLVREGRLYWKRSAPRTSVRLLTRPPAQVGIVRYEEGPAVTKKLLGAAKVVAGRNGKSLQPIPEAEARAAVLAPREDGGCVH